jgi:3-dehydroquinate synthase
MITQTVGLPANHYDILIGNDLLNDFGPLIRNRLMPKGHTAIVTDSTVWALYGKPLSTSLAGAGIPFDPVILPPGEENKSLEGLKTLYSAFASMQLRRNGLIIAFGGGVIGDLAGFAAATWMRGTDYIQIPTTLLAQVDSSVGGKTAIDLPEGKNLAGAFYQPKLVLADIQFLDTLSPRDFRCGMAEVIKYGVIRSTPLLASLREPRAGEKLAHVIRQCCRIKSEIVARDERDTGERMILNFGHTFGHAIEKLGGYARHNHGEAVAMGMVLAMITGENLGVTVPGRTGALRELLELHDLETHCPYPFQTLLPLMALDKKNEGLGIRLVLLKDFGEAFVHTVSEDTLNQALGRGG